jgi:predicted ribosomally synthesized six-cysteine peptide SCIFF
MEKMINFVSKKIISIKKWSNQKEVFFMKRIKTLETRNLNESAKKGGCGECQTSCQSASKTSCSVANQKCEQLKK